MRAEQAGLPGSRESTFVHHARAPVAVHCFGGTGPPAVLVHATGFHGRVWEPVADRLRPRLRCLAPDLRGHGDSPVTRGDELAWSGFAADVLAVVDDLDLEHPVGVGHSSGATALLLAEQARPGTFRALYCYEPVLVPADPPLGPDPDSWLAERARARRSTFASRAQALAHYEAKRALATLDPHVLRLYVEHGLVEDGEAAVRLKCRPEHEARIYEMAAAHDAYVRLNLVRCPVTLARGERSDAAGARGFADLVERLPEASTETLPGLGHLGPLESPPAVAASILEAFSHTD